MDWDAFFEKTRLAAGVDSFAKLAPKLGVTDGAIGHYRRGRQIPSVWVVADALRIQGHPAPEKAAVEIMRSEARTAHERKFWKRLGATATLLLVGVLGAAHTPAQAAQAGFNRGADCALCEIAEMAKYYGQCLWIWLAHRLQRSKPGPDHVELRAWT